jgi:hypothetical protein
VPHVIGRRCALPLKGRVDGRVLWSFQSAAGGLAGPPPWWASSRWLNTVLASSCSSPREGTWAWRGACDSRRPGGSPARCRGCSAGWWAIMGSSRRASPFRCRRHCRHRDGDWAVRGRYGCRSMPPPSTRHARDPALDAGGDHRRGDRDGSGDGMRRMRNLVPASGVISRSSVSRCSAAAGRRDARTLSS